MGVAGVHSTTSNDPVARLAQQVADLSAALTELRSIVRRDCLRARGYELEVRALPTPGLYLVNKTGGPGDGTATFIGP